MKAVIIFLFLILVSPVVNAQEPNQCLLVNENNVEEAANRIWNTFSSLGLESALSAVDSLKPGDNGYEFKNEIKEELRKKAETEESFFEMKERAKRELEMNNITKEQREAYIPKVSELLYKGIVPFGYGNEEKIRQFIFNLVEGREMKRKEREDAWRFYLGLPQEHNTFGISDYRPGNSVENKYYYKINQYVPGFKRFLRREKEAIEYYKDVLRKGEIPSYVTDRDLYVQELYDGIEWLITLEKLIKFIDESGNKLIIGGGTLENEFLTISEERDLGGEIVGTDEIIMVNYKLSRGQDERGSYISYYDIWNLEGSMEGEEGLFGKPFEIYDRIYYDPETFEIIEEETGCDPREPTTLRRAGKIVAQSLNVGNQEEFCEVKTCIDDYSLNEKDDCWNQDALCVENKCVKFEDMGWSQDVLRNVLLLKNEQDRNVRLGAASALGEIKSQEAVLALIRALENDQDGDVRAGIAFLLGEIKPPGLVFSDLSGVLANEPLVKIKSKVAEMLVLRGYYSEVANSLADSINLISSPDGYITGIIKNDMSQYAVLINQLHDAENRPQDVTRTAIIRGLTTNSIYYLISVGGGTL